MKKVLYILCFFIITSCSFQGVYKNRFSDTYSSSWLKINSDNTFEYIAFEHLSGYGYVKGSWKKVNDSIYLNPFVPELPITNQLIEINDDNKAIKLIDKEGNPLLPSYIKINGVLDSIQSDWNGNYTYKKFEKVNRIEVFDTQSYNNQIIADFKTSCNTCSYKIIVDWNKIPFKSIHRLDVVWLYKKNRLYPIDSTVQKINSKDLYFKKIDTIKPYKFWIKSWESMKNGFE